MQSLSVRSLNLFSDTKLPIIDKAKLEKSIDGAIKKYIDKKNYKPDYSYNTPDNIVLSKTQDNRIVVISDIDINYKSGENTATGEKVVVVTEIDL